MDIHGCLSGNCSSQLLLEHANTWSMFHQHFAIQIWGVQWHVCQVTWCFLHKWEAKHQKRGAPCFEQILHLGGMVAHAVPPEIVTVDCWTIEHLYSGRTVFTHDSCQFFFHVSIEENLKILADSPHFWCKSPSNMSQTENMGVSKTFPATGIPEILGASFSKQNIRNLQVIPPGIFHDQLLIPRTSWHALFEEVWEKRIL